MGHEFRVWLCLGGGIASLKFRQFKSAVCDAFGVVFILEVHGCVWFASWDVGVLGLLALVFCVVGWGLVIWLNVELLVVNCLLRTCTWFTCMHMTMTTGHLTWSVVF